MEIQYLGHSCFRIKSRDAILLTDPFSSKIGLNMPKTTADIVTISHQHDDHNNKAAVEGTTKRPTPFIIQGPGEYEISGVFIYGLASFHDSEKGAKRGANTIYTINLDEVRLAHLGDLGHRLDDALIEEINGVDILFIPVGGEYTIGPKEAVEIINRIDPKIVIPMHYKVKSLNLNLAPLEDFLKEIGVEGINRLDSLVISKEKLPEERQVVVLNGRNQDSST